MKEGHWINLTNLYCSKPYNQKEITRDYKDLLSLPDEISFKTFFQNTTKDTTSFASALSRYVNAKSGWCYISTDLSYYDTKKAIDSLNFQQPSQEQRRRVGVERVPQISFQIFCNDELLRGNIFFLDEKVYVDYS